MNSSDIARTTIILIVFIFLYLYNFLVIQIKTVKNNWPLYRCNPMIMPMANMFGHDTQENFFYCIQSMQTSSMGQYLEPINYNINLISGSQKVTTESIKGTYEFINYFRNSIIKITQKIFAVFVSLVIEMQKIVLGTRDVIGKLVGILSGYLFMFEGATSYISPSMINTFNKYFPLCFHPDTLLKLEDGNLVKMKDIEMGQNLKNGNTVCATMKIKNFDKDGNIIEKLYEIENGENGENGETVYVTGSHLIYDADCNKFIPVSQSKYSKPSKEECKWFSCLITSDHLIPIGKHIFHDWEDNNGSVSKNLV
jgi:hypothetical protein